MLDDYILFALALAAVVVAWWVSGRRAAARYRRALRKLEADLRAGPVGAEGDRTAPAEVKAIRARLATAGTPVRAESNETLARLARFLRTAVVKPLVKALHARGRGVRPRIQQALDAIEDIEFFAEAPKVERTPGDLVAAVEGVAREYERAFKVEVRLDLPGAALPCRMDGDAVRDAVYMLLANAGLHGGGQPVDVSLRNPGKAARLVVRDSGDGFPEEALRRATEPFFSTVPGSLGLGLTHARQVIEAHGGTLTVGNHAGGGGEAVLVVPAEVD